MSSDLMIGNLCKARVEPTPEGFVVVSLADPYVRRMHDETGESLLILAACALRKDPTCIEAHLLLSENTHDEASRMQHLKAAVRAGDHLWGQVAAENGPLMCWKNPGMRPYLRAIQGLGDAFASTGNNAAAEFCYRRLEPFGPGYAPMPADVPAALGMALN